MNVSIEKATEGEQCPIEYNEDWSNRRMTVTIIIDQDAVTPEQVEAITKKLLEVTVHAAASCADNLEFMTSTKTIQ